MRGDVRIVNETDWEGEVLGDIVSVKRAAEHVLGETIKPFTVILVSPNRSRFLNKTYRSSDKQTNILSFAESRELVCAPEVIAREARSRRSEFASWFRRLLIHGILHIEGYTHNDDNSAVVMEALEDRIAGKLENYL